MFNTNTHFTSGIFFSCIHICDISRRVRLDSLKREQDGGGGGQYSADLTQRALLFCFHESKKKMLSKLDYAGQPFT